MLELLALMSTNAGLRGAWRPCSSFQVVLFSLSVEKGAFHKAIGDLRCKQQGILYFYYTLLPKGGGRPDDTTLGVVDRSMFPLSLPLVHRGFSKYIPRSCNCGLNGSCGSAHKQSCCKIMIFDQLI